MKTKPYGEVGNTTLVLALGIKEGKSHRISITWDYNRGGKLGATGAFHNINVSVDFMQKSLLKSPYD